MSRAALKEKSGGEQNGAGRHPMAEALDLARGPKVAPEPKTEGAGTLAGPASLNPDTLRRIEELAGAMCATFYARKSELVACVRLAKAARSVRLVLEARAKARASRRARAEHLAAGARLVKP